MNWLRLRNATIASLLVGLVVTALGAWFVGGALVAPANRVVGPPPTDFPADAVAIPSDAGAPIAAWWRDVPAARATVLLLHPLRGDRRAMLSRARRFDALGYSTLLIDLQAHGETPGARITIGHLESHDVRAAVDFIRQQHPDHKIAIVGRSLGGASALFARVDIDALVLESVYPTVSEAVHNRVAQRLGPLHHVLAPLLLAQLGPRLGVSADRLRPIDRLATLSCPVLIASGDCDRHTTLEETRRMANAAREPKRLVFFAGAGHVDLLAHDPAAYQIEVVGFVDDALAIAPNEAAMRNRSMPAANTETSGTDSSGTATE